MISKLIDAATKISFFFGGRARHVQQNSEENSKEFSDLISPLIRYLHGRVGNRWNDVFSEICQTLPRDGMNADHIRSHVTSEVAVDYLIVDGEIYNHRGWPMHYGLYVDSDGILQKLPTRPKYHDRWSEDWRGHYVKKQGLP